MKNDTITPINELQDAGRKIAAKKDNFTSWKEAMNSAVTGEFDAAKNFPVPPYKTLMKEGISEHICNLVEYVRSLTPTKPKGWKVRYYMEDYTNKMLIARKAVNELLENGVTAAFMNALDVLDSCRKHEAEIALRKYISLDKAKEISGLRVVDGYQKNYKLRLPLSSNASVKRHLAAEAGEHDTLEELGNALMGVTKKKEDTTAKKLGVYSRWLRAENKRVYYVGARVAGNVHLVLTEFFDDSTAAYAAQVVRQEELVETLKGVSRVPALRVSVDLWRRGGDTSEFANFSNEEFMATFGISGLTYGNWVNPTARQAKLNATYDAFIDLAKALNISPERIGLGNSLGLQFGASGSGHALAHFRPCDNSINLTRDKGDGSLAHEFGHALDYRLGNLFGGNSFLTSQYRSSAVCEFVREKGGVYLTAYQAFCRLMGLITAQAQNGYYNRSYVFGRSNSKYWASNVELFARAFEAYVRSKNDTNDYLVKFTEHTAFRDGFKELTHGAQESYPYPTPAEMEHMAPLFDTLMDAMKEAI